MNRREFLSAGLGMAMAAPPGRPGNVLLIVSEGMHNQLGCLGDAIARTPRLDALARRSIVFDRAYCQFPLCAPSRTSFLSGRRPNKTRVFTNHVPLRTHMPDVVMLPELFRRNGWYTARIGKIYHGGPEDDEDPRSWDRMGPEHAPHISRAAILEHHQMPKPRNHTMEWSRLDVADEQTSDGANARRAAGMIREFAKEKKRFFLGVGFRAPHAAYNAPSRYFDLYDPAKMPIPRIPKGYERTIPEAAWYEMAEQQPLTENETRAYRRAFYAFVSFLDAQTGVVLDALDESGLRDNTTVVFLSDHGYHIGEHGMWHKMTLFEESTRLPLIIGVPGMRGAGRVCHRLVEFVDVYPTLADVGGIQRPGGLDGVSLVPALQNPSWAGKEAAYTTVGRNPNRARMVSDVTYLGQSVRTDRWRYTEWDEGRKGIELYDEDADPGEMHNLAGDVRFDDEKERLRQLLGRHSFTLERGLEPA